VAPELRRTVESDASDDMVDRTSGGAGTSGTSSSNSTSGDRNASASSGSDRTSSSQSCSSSDRTSGTQSNVDVRTSKDGATSGAQKISVRNNCVSPNSVSQKMNCLSQSSKPSGTLSKASHSLAKSGSDDSLFAVPNRVKYSGGEKKKSVAKKKDLESAFDKLLTDKESIGTAPITDDNNLPITIGRGRRKFKPLLPYKTNVPDNCSEDIPSSHSKANEVPGEGKKKSNLHTSLSPKKSNPNAVVNSLQTDKSLSPKKTNHSALVNIRPTIADLVKVRERRKSFDRDTSSGSEFERRKSTESPSKKHNKSSRRKHLHSSKDKRNINRQLSQSSIDSSSESEQTKTQETDSSIDSINLDDNAEPGTSALPVVNSPFTCNVINSLPINCLPGVSSGVKIPTSYLHNISRDASHRDPPVVSHVPQVSRRDYPKQCIEGVKTSHKCCYKDYSSSESDDSSLSDTNNIQVDLDTEQTQTFSLTDNNLHQVSDSLLYCI